MNRFTDCWMSRKEKNFDIRVPTAERGSEGDTARDVDIFHRCTFSFHASAAHASRGRKAAAFASVSKATAPVMCQGITGDTTREQRAVTKVRTSLADLTCFPTLRRIFLERIPDPLDGPAQIQTTQ